MVINSYIGGDKWKFSDKIYAKLTNKKVSSNYNPTISVVIKKLPGILPNKELFGFFWSTPTFKDADSSYLLHTIDNEEIDYIVSTSSGNTVEGMARTIKNYNQESNKNIIAILLVPELSAYKVSKSVIEDNSYVKYVVLKNSTLDSTRDFAKKLINRLLNKYKVICAKADLKTAAYSQIGLVLNDNNLLNEDTCFVQTVSGGVGPAGLIEAAYQLKANHEILVIQPWNGKSAPIIDALNNHSKGGDPLSIFDDTGYVTSQIEPTLGSTRPFYAIDKFIQWRENGGRIFPSVVNIKELEKYKDKILNALVKAGVYPTKSCGLKLFELEKSGFMAFTGAITSADRIESKNIVVNFTGRYPDQLSTIPVQASPHILFDPSEELKRLLSLLDLK